jgi:mRNA interferase MazF
LLHPSTENGLKVTSLVRVGKIATIDKSLVLGKMGGIGTDEMEILNRKLLELFDIKTGLPSS